MSDRRPSPAPTPTPDPPPPSEYFFERPPWNNRWLLFSIALLVACFDFLAGPIVFFPLLFVIPVALLAWNSGLSTALKLAVILSIFRFTVQYFHGIPYALPAAVINAIIRLAVLFLITFLCAKLSETIRALRARVRTLEGFLPTCSFCKDIRDDAGNWHPIEEYVASRSEARFSHGVCPKCAEQHYGDVLNNNKKKADAPMG